MQSNVYLSPIIFRLCLWLEEAHTWSVLHRRIVKKCIRSVFCVQPEAKTKTVAVDCCDCWPLHYAHSSLWLDQLTQKSQAMLNFIDTPKLRASEHPCSCILWLHKSRFHVVILVIGFSSNKTSVPLFISSYMCPSWTDDISVSWLFNHEIT